MKNKRRQKRVSVKHYYADENEWQQLELASLEPDYGDGVIAPK